jgi:extensin-like protein
VKILAAIAFLLATTVAVMAEIIPLPRARPLGIPGDAETTTVSPCQSRLAEMAAFKPLPSITGPGDCTATDVVALDAVLLPDKHRIALFPAATLRCPMAEAVTHWIRDDVAPTIAAQDKSLRGVETLDSFDCRRRNGVKDAKISEHGRANALDVRAFKLANGAAIELNDASVDKSLREKLRQSACSRFSTVLGNGADAYHDSHVHLDLLERSNHYRICQWDVLDVAETAALAAKKAAAAVAPNPTIVNLSDIPLPRPRPIALSDRPHNRSVRLREAQRRPLFSLFAPLLKGMPR